MKRLFSGFCVVLLAGTACLAQEGVRSIDYSKSSVSFVIRNAGLNVDGSFKDYTAVVAFNPSALASTHIEGKIKVASISTGINARDNHLRKEDFFHAEKFPEINFKTTGIKAQAVGYTLIGKLTIKDVTKEVSFPMTVVKDGNGERFEAKLTIDRRDFHVGEDSWVMSDDVVIILKIATK